LSPGVVEHLLPGARYGDLWGHTVPSAAAAAQTTVGAGHARGKVIILI
jgi:hypothetical protein